MKIYIPSQLGDIRLINEGGGTRLIYSDLTAGEREKLEAFLNYYKMTLSKSKIINIPEDIVKAHKRFLRVFKLNRPVLNVAKFKDGKMTLVQEFDAEKTEAGATVEKPPRGCPMPTMLERAESRACEVLNQFLDPRQKMDFEANKAFIVRGNYTGYPYMVISRWNPLCERYGLLYSVPDKRRICASLPGVPPSEEVLAMKFSVEFIEKEFVGL